MPPFSWPVDPVSVVQGFERIHHKPRAGALLAWAGWTLDALHYLDEIDSRYDGTRVAAGHRPDVVDVAHARWATGTAMTALDLCAAGLARAFCSHVGQRELDVGDLGRTGKCAVLLRGQLPRGATTWLDGVLNDPDYQTVKEARDVLTHSTVRRHFSMVGGSAHDPRLEVETRSNRLPVRRLVEVSVALADRHVSSLFGQLLSL